MGIQSGSIALQRFLCHLFRSLKNKHLPIYCDDILLMSKTFDDMIRHLTQLLDTLRYADFTLKDDKCALCYSETIHMYQSVKKWSRNLQGQNWSHSLIPKSYKSQRNQVPIRYFLLLQTFHTPFYRNKFSIVWPSKSKPPFLYLSWNAKMLWIHWNKLWLCTNVSNSPKWMTHLE